MKTIIKNTMKNITNTTKKHNMKKYMVLIISILVLAMTACQNPSEKLNDNNDASNTEVITDMTTEATTDVSVSDTEVSDVEKTNAEAVATDEDNTEEVNAEEVNTEGSNINESDNKDLDINESDTQTEDESEASKGASGSGSALDLLGNNSAPSALDSAKADAGKEYIANRNSGKLHYYTCDSLPYMKNRVYFSSKEEAYAAGYTDIHKECMGGR